MYIEKHGTNIQSDSYKLSLRSKRERHVYRINNSPDCYNITKRDKKNPKMITKNGRHFNYCTPFWWNLAKFGASPLNVFLLMQFHDDEPWSSEETGQYRTKSGMIHGETPESCC